jgi:hypothetical protein
LTTLKHTRARVLVAVAALLLISGSVALSAEFRARPITEPAVYDGRGRLVGDILSITGEEVTVAVRFGPTIAALNVKRSSIRSTWGQADLSFESTDCSGPAFGVDNWGPFDSVFSRTIQNGTKIYTPSGSARTIAVNSTLVHGGACSQVASTVSDLLPYESVGDLAAEFLAPFTLRSATP